MYPSKEYPSYGTFIEVIENNLIDTGWDVEKIVLTKKAPNYQKFVPI